MRVCLILTVIAATPASALAADNPATVSAPTTDKKVCRDNVSTGSLIPRRSCRTRSEWKAIDAETQQHAGQDRLRDQDFLQRPMPMRAGG